MRVFHGTTPQLAERFLHEGIDAHLTYRRSIHGPQDGVAGIYVTPKLSVARRFGLCVLAIELAAEQLTVPPNLLATEVTVHETLSHHFEPQAFVSYRVEPFAIRVIECHENGYPFNPFERDD